MGKSQKELFRAIVVGNYDFDDEVWQNISCDAKDLIRGLLVTNPENRLSAKEALASPWIGLDKRRMSTINLVGTSQRIKTFNARMKLKSVMYAVNWITSSIVANESNSKPKDTIDEIKKDIDDCQLSDES